MPDETTSQGAPAPAATSTTTTATPAAATPPPATPQSDEQNPPWLAGRLQEARERVLKELGATDLNAAREAIAAAQKAAEDQKSAGQKLGETTKTLEAERARAATLEEVVKERAAADMGRLTADQQAAVRKLAPDTDPAGQLRTITALTPTWAQSATPPATTTTTTTTPAAAPPVSTAPPRDAPPSTTQSPPDHAAIYAELQKTNPILAARYATHHATSIFKT